MSADWLMRNPKRKPFCWQCGKPLNATPSGEPVYALVRVGEQDVRVHKICRQDALNYQRFDSTPRRFA